MIQGHLAGSGIPLATYFCAQIPCPLPLPWDPFEKAILILSRTKAT